MTGGADTCGLAGTCESQVKNQSALLSSYSFTHVHSNHKKMETAAIDKHTVLYMYSGVLFRLKNK